MVLRSTRDEMLLEMAGVVAKRGTCSRLQVGCVVSRDGRIITTGYNGAPSGMPHCDHTCDCESLLHKLDRHAIACASVRACEIAEHAERNAIAFAARYGLALEGSELHVTHAPCLACSRTVINAGIRKVVYIVPYRLTEGVELLKAAGVQVVQAVPGDQ